MRTRAAVMRAIDRPLSVEAIEVDPPGPGEVLVRMAVAGICGSDRHVLEGHFPSPVPAVCGHEGAGVVEEVGAGVVGIVPGDHVIQTFVGPCGTCPACRRGQRTFCTTAIAPGGTFADGTFRMHGVAGEDIATTLRLGSFSHHTVTPARNLVVVPPDVDLACAALVSCGVSTGVGAALNVAGVRPGDTVAVVGLGGVGAAAVLGSVVGGAATVVAVDVHESKRAFAADLGATHFVDARAEDPLDALRAATGGRGVDRVLLTVDRIRAEQYVLALEALAPGGVAVQVGTPDPALDHVPVPPHLFTRKQASLVGTAYGGMDPARDALRYLELHRAGRLPLERLITRSYPLDGINDAFADLVAGRNVRGVIRYDC